jgi:hypothetical protein
MAATMAGQKYGCKSMAAKVWLLKYGCKSMAGVSMAVRERMAEKACVQSMAGQKYGCKSMAAKYGFNQAL